jgi:hypothetical protein
MTPAVETGKRGIAGMLSISFPEDISERGNMIVAFPLRKYIPAVVQF